MSKFDPATGMVDGSIMPMTYFRADSLSLNDGDSAGAAVPDVAGNSWVQVTGSLQPLFKTNIFGSKPSVRFDGVDDYMTQANAGTTNRGTVFLLFAPTSAITTATTLQQPLAFVNNSGGVNIGIELGAATGGLSNEVISIQNPSGSYSAWTQSGGTVPTGTNLLTVRWNAGTSRYDIYSNGGANQLNAANGSPTITSSNVLIMGAGRVAQATYAGDIGVVLVYAAILTDTQKAAVHSYLQDVWGATAADYDANWASSVRRPTYHLNGQLVGISDGDGFPGGIGGVTPIDIQAFTGNGTWNKPPAATLVKIICIGAGGGGGTGRRGLTGTNKGGGAGGGGGAYSLGIFSTSALSSTESVTVGGGGSGAAAITTDDTDGNPGSGGGDSSFRAANGVTAGGGGGGGGGTIAVGVAGAAGAGHYPGGAGAAGGGTNGVAPVSLSSLGATGGAGGAGISNTTTGSAGGSGGANNGSGLAGGAANNTANGTGGNGVSGPANQPYTGTGGGGPRALSSANNAGGGGNGGSYGGGGGGATASYNGFTASAGGNGADGFVIAYSY